MLLTIECFRTLSYVIMPLRCDSAENVLKLNRVDPLISSQTHNPPNNIPMEMGSLGPGWVCCCLLRAGSRLTVDRPCVSVFDWLDTFNGSDWTGDVMWCYWIWWKCILIKTPIPSAVQEMQDRPFNFVRMGRVRVRRSVSISHYSDREHEATIFNNCRLCTANPERHDKTQQRHHCCSSTFGKTFPCIRPGGAGVQTTDIKSFKWNKESFAASHTHCTMHWWIQPPATGFVQVFISETRAMAAGRQHHEGALGSQHKGRKEDEHAGCSRRRRRNNLIKKLEESSEGCSTKWCQVIIYGKNGKEASFRSAALHFVRWNFN